MNDVPAFHELMWPTITALKSLGGSANNEELLAKVISIMNLSPEVQAVPHTDGRQSKVNYNLAWAKTYMKKAGLLDNSTRGVWTLTPAAKPAMRKLYGRFLPGYVKWTWKTGSRKSKRESRSSPR